jgi:hypothetical protein
MKGKNIMSEINNSISWSSVEGLATYIMAEQPYPIHYNQGSTKGYIQYRLGTWERVRNPYWNPIMQMRNILYDLDKRCEETPTCVTDAIKILYRMPNPVGMEINRRVRISPAEFDRLLRNDN